MNAHLADKGITLRSGTLVDATIIDAPSSTKNKEGARDPEMSSTKKGNTWYFGMKAHVGVDAERGVTHSLETSTAKVHDSRVWDELLHGEETSVWADKGYVSLYRRMKTTKEFTLSQRFHAMLTSRSWLSTPFCLFVAAMAINSPAAARQPDANPLPNMEISMPTYTVSTAAELMSVLANASGGDVIALTAGDYGKIWLRSLQFASEVTITSADPTSPATISGLVLRDSSNVTFDNLRFDYTFSIDDAVWVAPFQILGSDSIKVQESIFDGDLAQGVDPIVDGYGWGTALTVRDSSNVEIADSEFSTWTRGIGIGGSDNLSILRNNIHSMRADGINLVEVKSVLLEGNYLHDFRTAEGSGDHADMIQMWSTGASSPSIGVTIRGNMLDIGEGGVTQSIFMRNELVDQGRAGSEFFYRDIVIEENIILSGHLNGIAIGETDGLTIRSNFVLRSEGAKFVPVINVAPTSTNVLIEQNVTSGVNGFSDQPTWSVVGNFFVQNTNPNAPGFYEEVFLTSSLGGRVFEYIVDPDSALALSGAGASRLYLNEPPADLLATFDVSTHPENASLLVFDAKNVFGPTGRIGAEDAQFFWDFGDGTGATGQRVVHQFDEAGAFSVKLVVIDQSGQSAAAVGRVAIAGDDVLSFDPESGLFFADAYGSTTPIAGSNSASVDVGDQQGIDLGAAGSVVSISKEQLQRFFGTDKFSLSMTIAADTPGSFGEIARVHGSFILGVNNKGEVTLQLSTAEDAANLTTKGFTINDGTSHDVAIEYNGALGVLQVLVNGEVAATDQVTGSMPPMQHWGLTFGNPWGAQNYDATITSFDLNATFTYYPAFKGDLDAIADTTVPIEDLVISIIEPGGDQGKGDASLSPGDHTQSVPDDESPHEDENSILELEDEPDPIVFPISPDSEPANPVTDPVEPPIIEAETPVSDPVNETDPELAEGEVAWEDVIDAWTPTPEAAPEDGSEAETEPEPIIDPVIPETELADPVTEPAEPTIVEAETPVSDPVNETEPELAEGEVAWEDVIDAWTPTPEAAPEDGSEAETEPEPIIDPVIPESEFADPVTKPAEPTIIEAETPVSEPVTNWSGSSAGRSERAKEVLLSKTKSAFTIADLPQTLPSELESMEEVEDAAPIEEPSDGSDVAWLLAAALVLPLLLAFAG